MSSQEHTPPKSTDQPRLDRVADVLFRMASGFYDSDTEALGVTTDRVLIELRAEMAKRHRDAILGHWQAKRFD